MLTISGTYKIFACALPCAQKENRVCTNLIYIIILNSYIMFYAFGQKSAYPVYAKYI